MDFIRVDRQPVYKDSARFLKLLLGSSIFVLFSFFYFTSLKYTFFSPLNPLPNLPKDFQNKFKFLVIGDWGSGWNQQKKVASAMIANANLYQPKFVLALGDNFYEFGVTDVNDSKFQKYWKDVYGSLVKIPWYIIQGNHDWRGNPDAQLEYSKIEKNWILPDYFYDRVFDVGHNQKAAFIFVETDLLYYGPGSEGQDSLLNFIQKGWDKPGETERQLDWFEKTLKKHQNKNYIFVVGHHPAVVCDFPIEHPAGSMNIFKKLLTKYKVSGYFYGHRHLQAYGVDDGVSYIMSGGGGKNDDDCMEGEWHQGFTFGYAMTVVDRDGFFVRFYDSKNLILYTSESRPPRSLVN